jgi:hypothetical protein
MAGAPPTPAEQDALVSSFLEIAAGQTPHTATQFLQVRLLSSPLLSSPDLPTPARLT